MDRKQLAHTLSVGLLAGLASFGQSPAPSHELSDAPSLDKAGCGGKDGCSGKDGCGAKKDKKDKS